MAINNKTIFVTGGTGLLGSHLLFTLASEGKKIKALHRKNSNRDFVRRVFSYYTSSPDELFRSIEWAESDMCDYNSLRRAVQGSEIVYHCAGSVSFESSRSQEVLINNTTGTANIVKASIETGIEKLCHVSSTSALGAAGNGKLVNESNQWNDSDYHSTYAISKYRSESEVWEGIKQGLCAVIVNPSVIFGPGDWYKGSSLFFSRIAKGMPFCTAGVTGYVDVRDVVTSMIRLTNSPISNERFIVSSQNLSFREVFSMIADSLAVRKPFVSVPELLSLPLSGFLALIPLHIRNRISVTPETLHAAFSKVLLDNTKIRAATNISFIPISKSIEDTSRIFSAERQGKR